jgi:hypothetical protein
LKSIHAVLFHTSDISVETYFTLASSCPPPEHFPTSYSFFDICHYCSPNGWYLGNGTPPHYHTQDLEFPKLPLVRFRCSGFPFFLD